jgi:hypothetical protein
MMNGDGVNYGWIAHLLRAIASTQQQQGALLHYIASKVTTAPADQAEIAALTKTLSESHSRLQAAMDHVPVPQLKEKAQMANPLLDALAAQVTAQTSLETSVTTWITGEAARIQAAVNAAIAGGATAAELAPVQAEVDALAASAKAMNDALVANTPVTPALAKQKK